MPTEQSQNNRQPTGADILLDSLCAHGTDRIFLVPGESYLAVLDSLCGDNRIDAVTCRHEGGAGFMAVGDAKLTKKPGVVFVSRGPGATNMSIALHLAQQDGVPLVIFVGQVAEKERGRASFQEVDYTAMFGQMAKSVFEVSNPAKLSETIARAFHDAMTPTRGPVVIAVMEDMLCASCDDAVWPVLPVALSGPAPQHVTCAADMLATAKRPLIVAGSSFDNAVGRDVLRRCAQAWMCPVALTFKYQQNFDNHSPLYAGHLGFKIPPAHLGILQQHDLLVALGTRLGDIPSQNYQLPSLPNPTAPIIHVSDDPAVLGRVFPTELAVASDAVSFTDALAERPASWPAERKAWLDMIADFMTGFRDYQIKSPADGLDFGQVVMALSRQLDDDIVMTMDSGNFSSWVHLLWPFRGRGHVLAAAGGAMGLGLPAALAAGLRVPDRPVLAFVGDGGIMMTGNELGLAAQRGLPLRLIIANNSSFGTIRLHQEKAYPGRVSATELVNPDFTQWARAFGVWAETLSNADDTDELVKQALSQPGPSVLNVITSTELVSAFASVTQIRQAGR